MVPLLSTYDISDFSTVTVRFFSRLTMSLVWYHMSDDWWWLDFVGRFKNVSLYSPDGSLLVRDLSFQVVTGQSVIIMGPNGRYVPIGSVSSILSPFLGIKPLAIDSWCKSRIKRKLGEHCMYPKFIREWGYVIWWLELRPSTMSLWMADSRFSCF